MYLLSGIARWNADRQSEAVFGRKGRRNRVYSSPLIQRLNARCKALFGTVETEEENFRAPAPASDELLGLEYLFRQSTTSEDLVYSASALQEECPSGEEEVTTEVGGGIGLDDGYESDGDHSHTTINPLHVAVTDKETAEALDPSCVRL